MRWNKNIQKAPDGVILEFCSPNGDVYQGEINHHTERSHIYPLKLDSHGCGCCGESDPLPIAWRLPAAKPAWLKEKTNVELQGELH